MDSVPLRENIRGHLRVPSSGLMSEVNTGFQQLFHRNYAHFIPSIWFDFRMSSRIEPPPFCCEP